MSMYNQDFEALHKHSKERLEVIVKNMGFDEFITFFKKVYLIVNKCEITREEVLDMMENAPKAMCYKIKSAKVEYERKGLLDDFEAKDAIFKNC